MTKSIGARIKHAREKAGLTMVQLAKCVGVSKQAVWGWEVGVTKGPKPEHLLAIRDVLNVSLDWLILGTGEMQLRPSDDSHLEISEHHKKLLELYDNLPESDKKEYFQSLQEKKLHYEAVMAELLARKTNNNS